MDIRKIIKEELDEFEWIKDIDRVPLTLLDNIDKLIKRMDVDYKLVRKHELINNSRYPQGLYLIGTTMYNGRQHNMELDIMYSGNENFHVRLFEVIIGDAREWIDFMEYNTLDDMMEYMEKTFFTF